MKLRQQLKTADDPTKVLWNLDPLFISAFDLKALLLICKARKSDPLGFLALEARWWIGIHAVLLKKRFLKRRNNETGI